MTADRPARGLGLLSVVVLVAVAILCGLGTWQLQRLGEKRAFLDRLAAQADAPPQALPPAAAWSQLDLAATDLMRVRLSGTWLPQASATVRVAMPEPPPGTRGLGGFGRYLITAVRLDTGGIVLVNRGFAPEAMQAALPAPTGRAEIIGFVRQPEAGNAFTPAGDAARRDFHVRDPAIIAPALGLAVAPFMVEAERAGDAMTAPVGVVARELIARIPNNHLQYALTWFGLALTLVGVFVAFVRSQRARHNANRS
jgi:surfeit locus 1 family protein